MERGGLKVVTQSTGEATWGCPRFRCCRCEVQAGAVELRFAGTRSYPRASFVWFLRTSSKMEGRTLELWGTP